MIIYGLSIVMPILIGVLGSFLNKCFKKIYVVLQFYFLGLGVYLYAFNINGEFVFGHKNAALGISLMIDKFSSAFLIVFSIFMICIGLFEWEKIMEKPKKVFFIYLLEGIFVAFLWSNDLFNIFVLIEAITLISSILIVIEKKAKAMKAAVFYLLFNSFSIFLFLIGIIWLYNYTGYLSIPLVKSAISEMPKDMLKPAFALMMTSLGIKSAVFPLYTWLPRAHSVARTSVSALLSGILVKTGLYAFVKIYNMFNIEESVYIFIVIGGFTAILGAVMAIKEINIKKICAFSTVSQLGWMITGFVLMGSGKIGGELFMFNHAIFKGALFLTAGIFVYYFETKDIRKMRGILKGDFKLAIPYIIFLFAIMGFPILGGYTGKALILKAVGFNYFFKVLFEFAAFLTIVCFAKLFFILFGKKAEIKKISKKKYLALYIMAIVLIINGVYLNGLYANIGFIVTLKGLLKWFLEFAAGLFLVKFLIQPFEDKLIKINYEMGFETAMISAFAYFTLLICFI